MNDTIKCPHCGEAIEVSSVLRNQIEKEVIKTSELERQKEMEVVRKKTEEDTRRKLAAEMRLEGEDMKRELKEKDKKLSEFREQELELRKQKRELEEKQKELSLEVEKRVGEEKKKIEDMVFKRAYEEHRLRDLEKEKVIESLKKSLEEAQRKASQGSQQLQGEVLELDVEELLRKNFPYDLIEPVGKGIVGADIRHVVKSAKGTMCGVILWEIKRTKAWVDGWTVKLKDDLRAEKANIPIIITTALPVEAKDGLGLKDGVWACSFAFILPLATLVRQKLYEVAYQKAVNLQKGDKAEMLYEYVTGHEFRQQVEAMVEVYRDIQLQIVKERVVFERSWKMREAQVKRLLNSTAAIYGSMQGLVGSGMPQVKGLEMEELASGE